MQLEKCNLTLQDLEAVLQNSESDDHAEVEQLIESYDTMNVDVNHSSFVDTLRDVSGHVKTAVSTVLAAAEFRCDVRKRGASVAPLHGMNTASHAATAGGMELATIESIRDMIAQKRSELKKLETTSTARVGITGGSARDTNGMPAGTPQNLGPPAAQG